MTDRLVCHLIDYGGRTGGSFIPALAALGRALQARGDRLAVVATYFDGAAWQEQLAMSGIDVRLVGSTAEAREALQAMRPYAVHSHFLRYDVLSATAAGEARVFWHVHSARDHYSPIAKARAFAKYRLAGRRVEGFVAVCEAIKGECARFFAPRERVFVIPNAVDVEWFRPPTEEERARARARFGFSDSEKVGLFFDRAPLKGGALARSARVDVDGYQLLVVGGGGGEERQDGHIVTTGRAADTRPLFWASDALIFASSPTRDSPLAEGMPFVILEAMACGLPIATSDIPVARELSEGVDDLFLYSPSRSGAIDKAVTSALQHRSSGSGRRQAVTRFSLDAWTGAMLKLYA